MQKTKEGISLIVLVITILVMIILAAAIIITLNNNGIISKANEAVDKTNEKQVEELASLAWADAYAENVGKSDEELLQALKESVKNALENNNLSDDYTPYVTTKGVEILKGTGWVQTSDRHVIKGDTVLNIGADISYDETKGGTVSVETDVDWKVLGAENGELLIMSTSDVKSYYELSGTDGYENGISKLNEICEPYGKGAYATNARSITVEDVDRVTGYDKTTYEGTLGSGKIKYGESITYYWDNTSGKEEYPYYVTSRGVTGNLSLYHPAFRYHNGKEWVEPLQPSNLTDKQEICTLTQTYYYYDVDKKTDLAKGTDAYSMLFGNDKVSYWLASPFVGTYSELAGFGLRWVNHGAVSVCDLELSYGGCTAFSNVRAVVQLSPEYNL